MNVIAAPVMDVLDDVKGKTFVKCDKALPFYNVLIPLIFLRYIRLQNILLLPIFDSYILRSSLADAFSGTPDQLIDHHQRSVPLRPLAALG